MNIYDKNGNVLLNAVLTKSAEHEEELMRSDFVRLSYDDVVGEGLPVDAYIIPYNDGVHYKLFEPYVPEQKNAQKYHYEPQFQHPKMYLSKVPFVRDSYDTERNPITLMEWSYTGFIGTLLEYFCNAINAAFGFTDEDVIEYLMVGEFENIVSTTFTAQDILSALSNVANQLECEWHIDWHEKTLYFGHIQIDRQELEESVLEVDSNIGVPSVRNAKEGYWNAYQPQGSTRNITVRAASGENVQANVRLALNKTQYPDGIIYTDGEGHILTKAQFDALGLTPYIKSVIYESVYPKLDLFVYDVRYRERYLLDDDGNKVIDHYEGSTPVYKRYAVWFMRLAYPTYNQQGEVTGWTDYTIDPETQVIDGKVLMGAFQANTRDGAETSPLAGQGDGDGEHYGFELAYHETGEVIPPGSDGEGDTGVTIKAGDYEIILQQKDDFIIPSTPDVGMIPKGKATPSLLGNVVNLYNIVMSDDYLVSAQNELENETLKTIAHDTEDNNTYTFKALETAFEQSNPNLYIGRKVTYRNGGYELRTRVMKLVTKLDYSFEQEITIGNEVLKGNQTTMREKVDTLITAFAQGGGGLSQNQVLRLIENWVTPRFLSKIKEDTAAGRITFLQGLEALVLSVFNGIRNNGRITSDEADIPRFVSDTTIDGILHVLAKIVANQIESDNFNGDGPFDTGFELTKGADGITSLVIDKLFVRMKAIFNELEIRKISYSGGNIIFSHAGSKVVYVTEIYEGGYEYQENIIVVDEGYHEHRGIFGVNGEYNKETRGITLIGAHLEPNPVPRPSDDKIIAYRCYLLADDGSTATENWWRVDDQARWEIFNIKEGTYQNVANTFGWRKVIATGTSPLHDGKMYDYIDLSRTDCASGSDIPKVGDELVQMGNRTDAERQGFVTIEVAGDYAPAFKVYKGVNGYTLDRKRKVCISPKLTDIKAQRFVIETEYDAARVPFQRSEPWHDGMHCYYYDLLQHNGASWLCTFPEEGHEGVMYTTEEPSETATYWRIYAQKGEKGDSVSYDKEHSSIGYAYSSMGSPEQGREYPSDITSWSPTPPTAQKGKYLWTKDDTAYNNAGTIVHTITYGVEYQPNDGESVEIDSNRTFIKYCRQTKSQYTGQHPADSDFSITYPTNLGQGDYLWILNQVAYVGVANPLKSYSVSMLGTDGTNADPGADGYTTHFAYATSADGSQNFSTTNFNGATYIGTYRDQLPDDSTDYRHYVWTEWKGDDGKNVATCYVESQNVFITVDKDGKVVSDVDYVMVEVPFHVISGNKILCNLTATLSEDGSVNYAYFGNGGIYDPTNSHMTREGRGISIEGAYYEGRGIVLPADMTYTPSKVIIRVPKDTVLDEHAVHLNITATDDDGSTYTCLGDIQINGRAEGDDAVNASLTSPVVIIQQQTVDPYGLILTFAFTDILVTEGKSDVTDSITNVTLTPSKYDGVHDCCVVTRSGSRVTITQIATHQVGGKNVYVEEGDVNISFVYKGVTYNLPFRFKCNLLGTWKEEVIGDTETAVAEKITYGYDHETGEAGSLESIGKYIRSSENNISELQGTVYDEDHNVKLVTKTTFEQTINRISLSVESKENVNLVTDPDIYQMLNNGSVTRDISLVEGRTYTLTARLKNISSASATCNITINTTPAVTLACSLIVGEEKNFHQTFTPSATDNYTLTVLQRADVLLEWLQIEQGSSFTKHDNIGSAFQRTGIDIVNGLITLDAATVLIKNGSTTAAMFTNGKIKADYIDAVNIVSTALTSQTITAVDATIKNITIEGSSVFRGTIYAVDGEFTGKITATDGTIGGFKISANQLSTTKDGKTTIVSPSQIYFNSGVSSVTISHEGIELYNAAYLNVYNADALFGTKCRIGTLVLGSQYVADESSLNTDSTAVLSSTFDAGKVVFLTQASVIKCTKYPIFDAGGVNKGNEWHTNRATRIFVFTYVTATSGSSGYGWIEFYGA